MDELAQQDVNEAVSTPANNESESSSAPQGEQQQTEAAAKPQEDVPFHMHPRWQELIAERNEERAQREQLAQRLSQYEETVKTLQSKQSEEKKQSGPTYQQLIKRLEGIDPEFAGEFKTAREAVEQVSQLQAQIQSLQAQAQQGQMEKMRSAAETKLDSLYKANKIADEHKDFYRSAIENMAYNNPKSSLNDLDGYFKSVHEKLSKFFEAYNRKQRESYVVDKKKDQTPATVTGGEQASPKVTKDKPTRLTDPSVIKMIAEEMRRAKQKV